MQLPYSYPVHGLHKTKHPDNYQQPYFHPLLNARLRQSLKPCQTHRPTEKYIDSGSHVTSTVINNFVIDMIDKGKESFDRFPDDERKFSGITMGIDEEGYEAFLQELRAFRMKVGELVQKHKANRVYRVNIGVFPVTKKFGGADKE
ncbi:MAG: DUF4423 domain-containing protein [Fibrobacteria bacterium]|nr:DUF4423 domain-containing protein [Fibrobacteria bacterium]